MNRFNRAAATAAALLLVALACAPREQGASSEASIETEDVDAGPTSNMVPLEDEQTANTGEQLSGLLPDDFPNDLPVYLPSSVSDFGVVSEAVRFLELRTPDSAATVRSAIAQNWSQRGWRATGNGTYERSGRNVTLSVTEEGLADTRIRIEYPAQVER